MSELTRYVCGVYGRVPSDVGDFVDYDEAEEKIFILEQQLQQAKARVAELEIGLRDIASYPDVREYVGTICHDAALSALVGTGEAWLLRKQADAIEEIFDLFSGSRNRYIADQKIKWLRLQADEAENG